MDAEIEGKARETALAAMAVVDANEPRLRLTDVLTDLMIWSTLEGVDFGAALATAREHHAEEAGGLPPGDNVGESLDLLEDALEAVEADEQARKESWPDEDLDLDLAGRIREHLTNRGRR